MALAKRARKTSMKPRTMIEKLSPLQTSGILQRAFSLPLFTIKATHSPPDSTRDQNLLAENATYLHH